MLALSTGVWGVGHLSAPLLLLARGMAAHSPPPPAAPLYLTLMTFPSVLQTAAQRE